MAFTLAEALNRQGITNQAASVIANAITTATAIPASTAPAALAAAAAVGVSTTYARSDHVHAIPAASNGTLRGSVLRAAAQADTTAVDIAAMRVDFNLLLAKLRTSGVIAP